MLFLWAFDEILFYSSTGLFFAVTLLYTVLSGVIAWRRWEQQSGRNLWVRRELETIDRRTNDILAKLLAHIERMENKMARLERQFFEKRHPNKQPRDRNNNNGNNRNGKPPPNDGA